VITRVHHVGVVVRRLEEAYGFWRDALGLPLRAAAEVADQGVRAALLACGPAEVELLEPTRPDTGVARFLERRGEGLHHLCLQCDDVAAELARLGAAGVELIDRAPRDGLAGRVAFLHPRAAAGALLELATPAPLHPGAGPATAAPSGPAGLELAAVTVRVADLQAARRRLAAVLDGAADLRPAGPGLAGALGGVTLEVEAAPAPAAALAGVRLSAAAADRLPGAVREAARVAAGGLALPPERTHGVPLSIEPRHPHPQERGDRR
jgi:methylmalonyl-CoA epimerase